VLWILVWCGTPAPRWLTWTIGGVLVVLYCWDFATDKTYSQLQESEPSRSEEGDAPPEAPAPVVLPEGVVPASPELRCASCQAGGLMVLPANAFTRRPGFICPGCGTVMRPPGTTGAYLAITVVGILAASLAAGLAVAVALGELSFLQERLSGAVFLGGVGVVVAAWAIKQLRLPIPPGATARPVGRKIWIIVLLVLLLGRLVFGGGMFFLLYYIHEMM
jgi:hypothetical protein